jgi:hypothetical protein
MPFLVAESHEFLAPQLRQNCAARKLRPKKRTLRANCIQLAPHDAPSNRSATSMTFKTLLRGLCGTCLLLTAPALAQDAPKMSADVVVHSVKVHTTKKDGKPWDILGGAPDLMVFVRKAGTGGQKHTTKVKKDSFEATFGERTLRISVGDEIEVIVYDQDEKLHDKIGEKTVKITQDMLKKREAKWDFDRVISLVLEFEP